MRESTDVRRVSSIGNIYSYIYIDPKDQRPEPAILNGLHNQRTEYIYIYIIIYIYIYTLSDKNSSDKIFDGQNFSTPSQNFDTFVR